jgi:hypothetical protein
MREHSVYTLLGGGLFEGKFSLTVLFRDRIIALDDDRTQWILTEMEQEIIAQIKQCDHDEQSEQDSKPHLDFPE